MKIKVYRKHGGAVQAVVVEHRGGVVLSSGGQVIRASSETRAQAMLRGEDVPEELAPPPPPDPSPAPETSPAQGPPEPHPQPKPKKRERAPKKN